MKPKVLVAVDHPASINSIAYVLKKLDEEQRVKFVVITDKDYSKKILNDYNIDFQTPEDYGLRGVTFNNLKKILEKESPDLILTGTSGLDKQGRPSIDQAFVVSGRSKGIYTLVVLDAWSGYSRRFSDRYTGEKFKFLPDLIAVMDKRAKLDMLKEGFNEKSLIITGNPYHSNLVLEAEEFTEHQRISLRKELGLRGELLFYYVASSQKDDLSRFGHWDLTNLILIDEALKELKKDIRETIDVVVNLHPRYEKADKEEILDYLANNSNITLVEGVNSKKLVLVSDLTIANVSTLAVDALIMGKPAISIQPNLGENVNFLGAFEGIMPFAYTPKDVKNLLKKVFNDKVYRKTGIINASGIKVDPNAAENIVNVIYEKLGIS